MPPIRKSAAVLLTRGDGPDLELFVVRRNPRLAFFGGYWALPGGVVDEGDRLADDWEEERVHRACLVRELFEECGVLPGALAARLDAAARDALRARLVAADELPRDAADDARAAARATAADASREWRALLGADEAVLDQLHTIGQLTTPPFSARTYRTHFHHLELPAGERATVRGGELVEGAFHRPAELLDRWRSGDLLIVPPLLSFLAHYREEHGLAHWRDALARRTARSEVGETHTIWHVPGIRVVPLRTPTLPPATTTNTYVVGERDLWVVDPATPYADEFERLVGFLDGWCAEGRRLAGILVTHHHHDHVAAVAPLAARYGLEVRAHAETLARLPEPVERTRAIEDGERIELGRAPDGSEGWALEALFTPGHDRGHLAFLDTRYKSLIAGDLVSTLSTIVIDPPEGHLSTYLASLRRVLALEPGVVQPAHGIAHPRGTDLLRRYLAHRAMREAALVAALEVGHDRLETLLPRVYDDVPEALHGVASRSLVAGLEKLVEEGRARADGARWTLVGNGTAGA